MKNLLIVILLITFGSNVYAQEKSTSTKTSKIQKSEFIVSGVCGMCEKRIEKAALIKGVKMADWDKESKVIKVVFNNKKTSLSDIQKAIIAVGHDAGDMKAADSVYNDLPDCCSYRDGVSTH